MTMVRSYFVLALTLFLQQYAVEGTQELTAKTFKEVTESGKNGMVKFFQPWCGHCTRMKPDWDKLAENAHSSVFIADVNCSDEEELCTENGVSGYPTIKVYKDGKVEDYKGPRGYDELNAYVDGNLAAKCSIKDLANTCSEKAAAFHDKWQSKSPEDIGKEIKRLSGMQSKSMQKDLKVWLKERLLILQQLSSAAGDEL